jgi:hypothetical protein
MRRVADLSADAVAVLLFISRQRLRLRQHIPLSEARAALSLDELRLSVAFSECVRGGWLLVTTEAVPEPHYSMVAAGGRGLARLVSKLN